MSTSPSSTDDKCWRDVLDFIVRRQAELPPHLGGEPKHNATRAQTEYAVEWMAGDTGLEVRMGDFAVHMLHDSMNIIPITGRGARAMHKFQEQLHDD